MCSVTHSDVFSTSLFNVLGEIRVGRGNWGEGEQSPARLLDFTFSAQFLKRTVISGQGGEKMLWQSCGTLNHDLYRQEPLSLFWSGYSERAPESAGCRVTRVFQHAGRGAAAVP